MKLVWPKVLVVVLIVFGRSAAAEGPTRLTLGSALAMAKSRAPAIREAEAGAATAQATASGALGGYLPQVTARGAVGQTWSRVTLRSNGRVRDDAGEALSADASLRASITLFDFGRTPNLVGAANAEARATALRADATRNEVSRLVAITFLAAVFDEDFFEVERTTLKNRERHAELAHALVGAGLRPPVEEARAKVELERARLGVLEAEARLQQDRVLLATQLLLDPTKPISLVRPSTLPSIADDTARAASDAATRRPEVHSARAERESRDDERAATFASRLPRLGLEVAAVHRWDRPEGAAAFFPSRSVEAFAMVSVPLFDWTVIQRSRAQERAVEAADARRVATTARVEAEAVTAAIRLRTARAKLAQAKRTAELAAATLTVVEARYQAGLSSPLELFDATERDADARFGVVGAERTLATATIEMLVATGRVQEIVP